MERAAAMTAINVGELAKRLSDAFFQEHPSTDLRLAVKTRDMYAHGYFTLPFAAVFKTAREDHPRLRDQVELLLRDSLI